VLWIGREKLTLHGHSGVEGFIHIASPLGGFSDVETAVSIGVSGGLNALKACAKTSSIKRFVFTSSSLAATFPKPNVEFSINKDSYNDEAMQILNKEPNKKGLYIYAAMKTETEKAMWKWMEENKPGFVFNAVVRSLSQNMRRHITDTAKLPNVNFGQVLIPKHQGFPSTIDWAHATWADEDLPALAKIVVPQWFISPIDSALLHVSALIHDSVKSERLFGFAEPWNFNQVLTVFRKLYPERKFPGDIEGLGTDRMSVPNGRAEEVLWWAKGTGWDGLEESLKVMAESWV
jgi:hypothetical protein